MTATQCRATKANGEPCQASQEFVDPETGYCPAHDPSRPDEMRKRGQKGGINSGKARRKAMGLDPSELPPLRTHEDARKWLEIIGRATATGRLGNREAQAGIRAVSEWVNVAAEQATKAVVEELGDEIERLKEELGEPWERPW